ncbi:MAG: hypothetical protein ACI92S_005361 [Planctomycetaceae bacterium]|jgi:hypothetical protein
MTKTEPAPTRLRKLLKLLCLRGLYLSGIVCILACLWFITKLGKPSDARLRSICKSSMKQIMIAVHNYHNDYDCFPPPFTTNDSGKRLHSWRTLILPYMEQHELYDRIKLNEPWDSPHNREAAAKSQHFAQSRLRCPAESGDTNRGLETNFLAIVGPRSVWQVDRSVRLSDITDGTANTICIAESATSGVHWMEPRDLYVGQMSWDINAVPGQGISSYHDSEFRFTDARPVNSGVSHVGILDGSVRFLPTSISSDLLEQLITVDDGLPEEGWGDRLDRSR